MRGKPADDFHRLSSGKEHPRVCGENTPANEHGFDPRRNIPAYAGKTATHQLSESAETEHPRVCGENPKIRSICCSYTGTSPRMRGKRPPSNRTLSMTRNIPAYAGKTHPLIIIIDLKAEHPRVCGENASVNSLAALMSGTSPRMRGKHLGHTESLYQALEHPRVCGENTWVIRKACTRHWNIPAYAGKTNVELVDYCLASGTSPRMRGKRHLRRPHRGHFRNIPAYAGKTHAEHLTQQGRKEHPRVCGENVVLNPASNRSLGTSPRMRGKRGVKSGIEQVLGNIPAYAGKTYVAAG